MSGPAARRLTYFLGLAAPRLWNSLPKELRAITRLIFLKLYIGEQFYIQFLYSFYFLCFIFLMHYLLFVSFKVLQL